MRPETTRFRDWRIIHTLPLFYLVQRGDRHVLAPMSDRESIAILANDGPGSFLLLDIYRPSVDEICYEVPRAMAKGDETHSQAAKRIFKEQTGIDAKESWFRRIGEFHSESAVLGMKTILMRMEMPTPFPAVTPGHPDARGSTLLARHELEGMAARGEITDSATQTSLLRLLLSEREADWQGESRLRRIRIKDQRGEVQSEIRTNRPDWSFQTYCDGKSTHGWTWDFIDE